MGSVDYIVLGIIVAIVGGACYYIYRAKKKGVKCVGCPHSKTCSAGCSCKCTSAEEK